MKQTLICILILISFSAWSQNYIIESNFEIEKIYRFTVKRGNIDSRKPITKDLALLTEVEATFILQDDRLKCFWKYGESKAVGPDKLISEIEPEYIEMFNLYRGIEIEIIFDPFLGGIKLLNYSQLKQNVKNVFLKTYNNKMTKIDSATMSFINQQIEPTFSTPEILLSTYFPEIGLYFNLYAKNFTDGIGMKAVSTYSNPFDGKPFPVEGEFNIDSIDENVLIIKYEEKGNQEEINRIAKETIEKLSKLGKSQIRNEEMPNFKLNSQSKYFYDLKLKLITKVILEKITEVTGITQTVTLEINLIE